MKAIDAKHGKFDLLLCTGDFFGSPPETDEGSTEADDDIAQLLDGRLEGARSTIPVYYIGYVVLIE